MAKYRISFILEDLPEFLEGAKAVACDMIKEGLVGIQQADITVEQLELNEKEKANNVLKKCLQQDLNDIFIAD